MLIKRERRIAKSNKIIKWKHYSILGLNPGTRTKAIIAYKWNKLTNQR